MADSTLELLRQDALQQRVKGFAGGNGVYWAMKDIALIRDYVMSAEPERIIRAAQPAQAKLTAPDLDKAALANMGMVTRSDIAPEDNPVCIITTPRVDLAGDTNNTANVDCTDFAKFCPVLDTHDSSKPPVAISTMPWKSGTALLAIAKFPKPGVSADSDRIAAAVRAGLTRGTSIGFLPLKWSFSKDPGRPLGVNFESIKLLEWSFCAQPCNQDCRVIGSVSSTTNPPAETRMVRSTNTTTTREQRIAEARKLIAAAYRA
jgi:hypothetical protein